MPDATAQQQDRPDPTRPFYAAVGTVDAAVAFARTGLTEAQHRLAQVQNRLAQVELEPRALAGGLQKEARALPGRVEALLDGYVTEIGDTVEDLNKHYDGLAARGRTLVARVRRQQATEDLVSEARETVSRAKATRTSTRRTASQAARSTADTAATARRSAKATGTKAKRTTGAATKATRAAAAKTGA